LPDARRQIVGQNLQVRHRVDAEEELHAALVPAIEMRGLREIRVAADEDLAKAARATNAYGAIDLGGSAFV
jgi:hypothetical protein